MHPKIFENFNGPGGGAVELQLDPPGTKVSCHGTKWPPQSAQKVSWRMKNFLQRQWLGQKAFSLQPVLSCPWPKQWLSSSAVSANESRIVRLNVSGRLMDVLAPSSSLILILSLVLILVPKLSNSSV